MGGVTVDKKEHPVKKNYYEGEEELVAVDLPGAYSMSPFTSEESITSSYVKTSIQMLLSICRCY
ncbi:MAG: FeoB small GTPase domain-containing protein [Suilimivivens sp.]